LFPSLQSFHFHYFTKGESGMSIGKIISQRKSVLALLLVTLCVAVLVILGVGQQNVSAAGTGPCDIYASGGTPCVAAHSLTRALYGAYSGRLYQVRRASDNATTDIGTLSAGGKANAAAQNSFCSGTTCYVAQIYDQSGKGNHLTPAPAGGNGIADKPAVAQSLPMTLGGSAVYGLWVTPNVGYRRNGTSGIATGNAAEGMYMVTSGTFTNNWCCFDYGNAETNNNDTGNGHMDAVYMGKLCWFGGCNGSGPWVMADLENGLFSGANGPWSGNTSQGNTFVTAMLKNQSTGYAIRGGNAQSGSLSTKYSGALPNNGGYNPMHKEGAIILGIGGDNSNGAVGAFFEGAMTSGFPSDATENLVQANIVAAGYGGSSGGGTPACGGSGGSGTFYSIASVNSGRVLDVMQPNTCDLANVDQWAYNGGAWQKWRFADAGSGYYTIINQNSGRCLDVEQPNGADGANVGIYACNGQTWQQWQMVTVGSNFQLKNRSSGKCLDVENMPVGNTANGANLGQFTCSTSNWQLWNRTVR
jgi:non-reducing end alpha-L-arabinofuranosidase